MRIFLTICRASVIMRHVVLMRLHQYCKRSSPILGQSPPRVPITGRSKPCMWKRSFQPWPRRSAVVLFSLVLAVLLAGCFPSHSQSTFDAAGPIAEKQLNLWHLIFWTAVIVFVAVEGALVYAMIKFRRRPSLGMPRQSHGNTRLEVAWTIAPVLVLAVIAVPTVTTIFDTANLPPGEVLEVTVTGHQWWFEFEYPEQGITTANELYVPVGKTVNLTLLSDDVIHSCWVPKLFGKTDMIPRNTNTMWFSADAAGEYLGQCAEFCGSAHAQMRFRVIAEDEASFSDWVAAPSKPRRSGLCPGPRRPRESSCLASRGVAPATPSRAQSVRAGSRPGWPRFSPGRRTPFHHTRRPI